MSNTPKFNIPLLEEGVAQERLLHNEAISVLDIVAGGSVKSKDILDPPGSPVEGDSYIIDGVGLNAWAGKDDNIVYQLGGIWNFIPPVKGLAFSMDDLALSAKVEYDGAAWVPFSIPASASLQKYLTSGRSQTGEPISHTLSGLPSGDHLVFAHFQIEIDLDWLISVQRVGDITINFNGNTVVARLDQDSRPDENTIQVNTCGGTISVICKNGDTIAISSSGLGNKDGKFEVFAFQPII